MDKVVDTQDKTRNKWKIIGIILGIIIAIISVIGFTYAYWLITKEQTNDNTLGTGCFNITFTSNTEGINLAQTYPISNSEGMSTDAYSFTITNTCDIVAEYYVNSEILDTSTLNPLYVKGVLNNKTPKVLTEYTEVEPTLEDATESYRLISGYLEEGESITYEYRQWMSDTTPYGEGTNETFESKITIFSSPVTTVCANCGTLKVAIGFIEGEPVLENTPFLDGPITRESIESLEFVTTKVVPNDAIGSWDVSEGQDGSVMAWYKDSDNDSLNEVYIGGAGGVKANSNSSSLFFDLAYLDRLDLTNLYIMNVTDMSYMFAGTGYSNPDFYIKAMNTDWNSSAATMNMFSDSKATDKFYAKDATAAAFISGAGFAGTVYDCSSVACP